MAEALEEHFVVRVADESLAAELRAVLEEESNDESATWSLHFTSERVGSLSIQRDGMARVYPATLHMLPTIVETYKSHNHVNLVKAADIGQIIFVHAVPEGRDADEMLQQFAELEEAGELPVESDDGVTLPMLNARERVFRKDFKVDPAEIQTIEQQLVTLMNGEAPDGWVFEDVQETFVVDDTGRGQWVPSAKVAAMAAKRKKNAG